MAIHVCAVSSPWPSISISCSTFRPFSSSSTTWSLWWACTASAARVWTLLTSSSSPHLPTSDLSWRPSGVEYDGTYSGSYGNFGAMASPLHPEAKSSDVDAKYSCTLHEPLSKSFTRWAPWSTWGAHNEPIVFRQFQDVFRQFPFLAPLGPLFLRFWVWASRSSREVRCRSVLMHVHVACLQLLRLMDLRSKRQVLWSYLRTSQT